LGGPRPPEDFPRCSKADRSAVRRAAWRLEEAARGRRPPLEEYVKAVAARANLPAPVVMRALEILEEIQEGCRGEEPLGPGRGVPMARHLQGVRDADTPGECGGSDHRGRQERGEEDEGMSSGDGVDAGAVRRPPGPADPVERLLREYPELGALGVDWLRTWAPRAGEQIVGMARVLRRYPWMAELIGQGPVGLIGPYSVEAYASRTGRRPAYR
jgi:hypothetical protein